jgi:hypothetical protein
MPTVKTYSSLPQTQFWSENTFGTSLSSINYYCHVQQEPFESVPLLPVLVAATVIAPWAPEDSIRGRVQYGCRRWCQRVMEIRLSIIKGAAPACVAVLVSSLLPRGLTRASPERSQILIADSAVASVRSHRNVILKAKQ